MEWICCAIVFYGVLYVAGKFFGERGENIAQGCLIIGSILLIVSLPIAFFLFLRFIIPVL
jgi:hypothetical protein